MSKRAEEAALKAYPVDICGYQCGCKVGDSPEPLDYNEVKRCAFQEGYEKAEKDTIERAISWLKEHANEYIVDVGVGYGEHGRNVELIIGGKCWEHLKQALEDD